MQDNKISSTSLFEMLYEKNQGNQFKTSEAISLVELMVYELINDKKSGFLSYCISIWNNSCVINKKSKPIDLAEIKSFSVDNSSIFKGDRVFGARDAYIWITLVELYLVNRYRVEDYYEKNKHLMLNKNMCSDENGRANYRLLCISKHLESEVEIQVEVETEEIKEAEKEIDDACIVLADTEDEPVNNTENTVEIKLCEESKDEKTGEEIIKEAEKRASVIIAKAYEQANEIKESANAYYKEQMELAEAERKAIINKLEAESDEYIKELREDSLQKQDENNEHYQIDRMEIKESVTQAREELNKISGALTKILDSVQLSSTEALFRQYSYLYDSIYSVYSFLQTQGDVLSKKLSNNLITFMEIIEENLSEYGILTIKTEKNSPFQGKYHRASGNISYFNPKTTYVTKSLRAGFIWDDVVMEKELVEIVDTSKNSD